MKLKIIFAWYDCWIGVYYDLKHDMLYFFPIPFVGLRWKLLDRHYKYFIGDGISFGEEHHYYKWKKVFTLNRWDGRCNNYAFEEVPFDHWYYNKGVKMSVWSNILRSLWAAQPFTWVWEKIKEKLETLLVFVIVCLLIAGGIFIGHKLSGIVC